MSNQNKDGVREALETMLTAIPVMAAVWIVASGMGLVHGVVTGLYAGAGCSAIYLALLMAETE